MRKKNALTLSMNPGDEKKIKLIASKLGCLWGGQPSISGLLRAIAEGEVVCHRKEEFESRREIASKLIDISQSIQEEAKNMLKD